jgi:hypothetical protein
VLLAQLRHEFDAAIVSAQISSIHPTSHGIYNLATLWESRSIKKNQNRQRFHQLQWVGFPAPRLRGAIGA